MTLSSRSEQWLQTISAMDISAAERVALGRAILRMVPGEGVLLSHISFGVRSLPRSMAFYDAVLEPLGSVRVWTDSKAAGYGPRGGNDCFALFEHPDMAPPGSGFHLAFNAASREAVNQFHAAGMAAGANDHGAPGLRPHYGPMYYACFVADPDGYKLEAVCQS